MNIDLLKKIQELSNEPDGFIKANDKEYSAKKLYANICQKPKVFMLIMSEDQNGNPRFSTEEKIYLIDVLSSVSRAKTLFEKFMNIKKSDGTYALSAEDCISCINKWRKPDTYDFVGKIIDDETGKPRFTKEDCVKASEFLIRDNKLFEQNAKLRTKDGDFRFDIQDCIELDKAAGKIEKYPNVFKMLTELEDEGKPRLSGEYIKIFMDYADKIEENPEFFNELISMKNIHNGDFYFNIYLMLSILPKIGVYAEHKDLFNEFILYGKDGFPRFKCSDYNYIRYSFDKILSNPEFFVKLINHKVNDDYTFNAPQCVDLLASKDDIENNYETFEQLISNGQISVDDLCEIMKENHSFLNNVKNYPALFESILDSNNYLFFNFAFCDKFKFLSIGDKIEQNPELFEKVINRFRCGLRPDADYCIKVFLKKCWNTSA